MARPTVSKVTENLYAILKPMAFEDEQNNWPLLIMSEACIGAIQLVNDYAQPDIPQFTNEPQLTRPNWSVIVDIDLCPCDALPWLAQLVGVQIPPEIYAESRENYCNRLRDHIRSTPGFGRGTPAAIIAATQLHLTGKRSVILKERDGGAYNLTVYTVIEETPDEDQTLRDILTQKPAGIILDYQTTTEQTWRDLFGTYGTWQAVYLDYTTWQDVLRDTP